MKTLKLIVALVGVLSLTACDGGRYSVAKNHLNNKVCYVYDWGTQQKLPATPENVALAKGDMFWADPQQCQ